MLSSTERADLGWAKAYLNTQIQNVTIKPENQAVNLVYPANVTA